MHRCLCIEEVLQSIAGWLVERRQVYARTLLRMALTCCLFFDPAMDMLWRHHMDAVNLSRFTQGKSIPWGRFAPEPLPSPRHILGGSALAPLFALDLQMLDMRHRPLELTPGEDVAGFAGAWPNMRPLLPYDNLPRGQYAASPLARGCKRLRELGLPVHVTSNAIPEDVTPETPHTEFVSLYVVWITSTLRQTPPSSLRASAHMLL
ncbi:hypothetical protein PsYK624_118690 [Phanerochaete sordida]|uniref:Uncharacterized protein n=1 Tax=Phanerochaete sordida TaxID=48140 RepID=A0A9P3LI33_9APHY|nr:hypothetical protein PsYK624_118690 [Phanerochaete sordida]